MSLITLRHAVVKSTISGDTLVIKPITYALSNENEQRISLNYIKAPKLAHFSRDSTGKTQFTVDKPYAFEAREYLRQKLIGQNICYTVDTRISERNRTICTIYLGKDSETGENIIESLVSEGLVYLQKQIDSFVINTSYQRLVLLDKQAKANKRGRYSKTSVANHIRNVQWTIDNPQLFVNHYQSLPPLDAIVEFIRDGNTVRCLLLPSCYFVTIQLAGIRCPMFKHEDNSTHEPYAEEAKQYVEERLLQRQVKVIISGVNKQTLVGTLLHPNGDIALYLLKEGLARCADWSLTFLKSDSREQYRTAENFAKDNHLKIWHNYSVQRSHTNETISNGLSAEVYQGHVLEVVNGDALIVRDLSDNQVKKIYLSSVRAPRAVDFQLKLSQNLSNSKRQQKLKRPLYEIPYLFEAREILRKQLIGQTVQIINDYIQPASNGYSERTCCTVYIDNVNIAETLISKGLAKAIRHQQDDKRRSSHYDALLIAEHRAEQKALGLFSSGSSLRSVIDLVGDENKSRAKSLLNNLQRNNWMEGVVEFIVSGSRFRIHLLKNDFVISLLLSSINCPRFERCSTVDHNSQKKDNEPFGAEALAFSEENFLQRNVYVDIQGIDRGGNFIGRLLTEEKRSVTLMLVQVGLAKVHSSVYGRADHKELLEAEEKSRKERLGIWIDYEESLAENSDDDNDNQSEYTTADESISEMNNTIDFNDSHFRRGAISHITSDLRLYFQYSEQIQALEQLQSDLQELFISTESNEEYIPEENELLAARFSIDNQWYRACVEKIEENNHISVYFVDYGNREIITDLNRLMLLPSDYAQLPVKAHKYELAYVRLPFGVDQREKIRNALFDATKNNECLIKVEYHEDNTDYISVYHANTKENLIRTLAEQSLLVVDQGHKSDQLQYF
ncbi:hypothetical protein I4U23_025063 [Adineta vaga]|nr:hypothetical protein I4U23_025063 [Adineta vaga]